MPPAPHDRGLQLDGPKEERHRNADRLRADTVPAPLDHHQPPSPPTRRRRQDPVDGQVVLLEEASCISACT
jgi:hypothetical protein